MKHSIADGPQRSGAGKAKADIGHVPSRVIGSGRPLQVPTTNAPAKPHTANSATGGVPGASSELKKTLGARYKRAGCC